MASVKKLQETKYIWMSGKLVAWSEAQTHVLTHTLHYGSGAFEGIRVYPTDRTPAIFRLKEHIDRLFYSAKALKMESQWNVEEVCQACVEVIARNGLEHGYLRPLFFYGYGIMGLRPLGAPVELAIACWPWGSYLPHESVAVKVSSYCRIHPRSSDVEAKLVGHYVNSIMATLELRGTEYHEALLLDYQGNIAEGPGENLFMVKDGALITPASGSILSGITRRTVFEMAQDLGIQVFERKLTIEELLAGDEAFFTGTAAEITPIGSLDKKLIGKDGKVGEVTRKIRDLYGEIVRGKVERYKKFLTYV
jgi:branched-chain amino acid aminotransferase